MSLDSMLKQLEKAKVSGGAIELLPDGFDDECIVGETIIKPADSQFGERVLVSLTSRDGKHRGALNCAIGSQNKTARDIAFGDLKALWAACLGYNPKQLTSEQVAEVSDPRVGKAALGADAFKGHVVRVRALHKENPRGGRPFVNLSFSPVLDAQGEPVRV